MWRHGAWVDPTGLLLLALMSACATPPAEPAPRGLGGVRSESVLTGVAAVEASGNAAPSPEPDALEPAATMLAAPQPTEALGEPDLERALRHELANAADPVPAALELADLLCALERHREALAAVEAALLRRADPALQVCRAGLLRDLGRRQQAVDALQELIRANGPGALHPGLLFECAELQWLVGDGEGAAATLHSLQAVHATDPWCATNRAALDGLLTELSTHAAAPRVRVRDLLASLRGNGTVSERIRLLGELVALADRESGARREHLRSRAVAIGCADESPAVRARAVQLADPAPEDIEAFCQAALADPAPIVRRFAAARTVECSRSAALVLLLDAIRLEADPGAFAALHAALAGMVTDGPTLAATEADDASARERIAAAWRQRCSP